MAKPLTRADGPQSVPALLHRNASEFANAPAYREKEYGIWQSWTWSQTRDEVEALALGFLELGLNEGDFVAIIGRNRPYLYWAMMAAQMAGAVPVPLYQDANAEEMAYVMGHCGARLAVVGDQDGRLPVEHVEGGAARGVFHHGLAIELETVHRL